MSFVSAALRFRTLAARHRRAVYGGRASTGTADGGGNNFSIEVGGVTRKFRAAFVRFASRREIEIEGFQLDCHAIVMIPDSLNIPVALGTDFTYLPTGEVFRVHELGRRSALSVERRYGLRRLET